MTDMTQLRNQWLGYHKGQEAPEIAVGYSYPDTSYIYSEGSSLDVSSLTAALTNKFFAGGKTVLHKSEIDANTRIQGYAKVIEGSDKWEILSMPIAVSKRQGEDWSKDESDPRSKLQIWFFAREDAPNNFFFVIGDKSSTNFNLMFRVLGRAAGMHAPENGSGLTDFVELDAAYLQGSGSL